jgi:hypothetical protein
MTVQRIIGVENKNPRTKMADKLIANAGYENGDVFCEWFNKTELKTNVFKVSSLMKIIYVSWNKYKC